MTLLSSAQTTGLAPLPWAQPQLEPTRVVLDVTFGGCRGAPLGATVTETPTVVTVVVYGRKAPGPVCAAFLSSKLVAVPLRSPVSGRALNGGAPPG